ncbi:MAG: DUF3592 domain-containing protein [Candidatus Sumerlaeota bacterium]|nr:DUF3592 domain-containing protein [Candidatus Sumerlaeota bacterium]
MILESQSVREDRARKKAEKLAQRRRENWVVMLFAIGMAGVIVTAIGALDFSRAFASWSWTPTQATIVETQLRWYPGARSSQRGGSYNVDVTYSYQADGEQCVYTDRYPKRSLLLDLGLFTGYYHSRSSAQAVADLYPRGSIAPVVFNPALPKDSRLETPLESGFRRNAAIELAMGILLALGGFAGSLILKRLGFAHGTRLEKPLEEPGIEL